MDNKTDVFLNVAQVSKLNWPPRVGCIVQKKIVSKEENAFSNAIVFA